MYELKILGSAQRDLDRLHVKILSKIKDSIMCLANDPRPLDSVKLTNEEGYRTRMGDYRVLYRIDDKSKELFIYRVKHRREAYR